MTNIWDALRQSFGDHLQKAGGRQRFELLPDTVVFLTDGMPTRGRFQDTASLLVLARMWNRAAGTVIHTVGIGADHERELLAALAKETYGYHVDLSSGASAGVQQERRGVPPEERRPNFTWLLKDATKQMAKGNREARATAAKNFYAEFFGWVNIVVLIIQSFFVSRIFNRFGVRGRMTKRLHR